MNLNKILIFGLLVFTILTSANSYAQDLQKEPDKDTYTIIHKDDGDLTIEGVIESSPKAKLSNKVSRNNWSYAGDEYYTNFPNLSIPIIKKVAVTKTYTNNSPDHRRRSLSSRGNLQSQYTRQRVNENITPVIMKYAKQYDLNPHIIRSIIEIESSYNPNAYSYAGACGLMQLKPGTAADMGVRDYWNYEQNIKAGTKYIRYMLDLFGDLDIALAAYNQGPGTVKRAGSRIPNGTAAHYVKKFYKALGKY